MTNDIWITGVGAVSSLGVGVEAFWKGLLDGRSGARRLAFPPGIPAGEFSTQIGAPVPDFSPEDAGLQAKSLSFLDISAQYALAASGEALARAGLKVTLSNPRKGHHVIEDVDPNRVAVLVGSGIGGLRSCVENLVSWSRFHKKSKCKRYGLPMLMPSAPAAQVAIHFQAHGECKAISTACAAGTMAIGDAWRLLRNDEADVVLCGGVEALLSDPQGFGLIGFDILRTMTQRNDAPDAASRPFDLGRDGFLLAEGAGILVLEREAFARARGATPIARLAGYASTCDALSMLQLDEDGEQIVRVMKTALENASIDPRDIGHINAHGTSTRQNDRIEGQALRRLFGSVLDDIPTISTKSMTGHAVAASGALEAIATALALHNERIHPMLNYETPDPECRLGPVPLKAEANHKGAALSNSFGFGGHNASLVLTRPL